jgi:transposase-like protein
MDGVVEIITGRERRRRWSVQDKLRFVAEMAEPGTRVRAVAARHGVCESLLFTWRRQVRDGVLTAPEMPVFMPVRMFGTALGTPGLGTPGLSRPEPPAAAAPVAAHAPARPQAGLIEIELGDGRQVRVGADVNQAALRRVLAALRG